MFCTYQTLIAKNREGGTRLDQLIDWCGGEDFDGLILLDECKFHGERISWLVAQLILFPVFLKVTRRVKGTFVMYWLRFPILLTYQSSFQAKTIELDTDGNPKTTGDGDKVKSSKSAIAVVHLQNRLPRARVVYCSATSVSHQNNLGFMARLGLWGPGTENPSGFHQFLERLKLLKMGTKGTQIQLRLNSFCFAHASLRSICPGALEIHAMHLKATGSLVARTLSYKSCSFDLVDDIGNEQITKVYNEASQVWIELHAHLGDRMRKINADSRVEKKIREYEEEGLPLTPNMMHHMELNQDSDAESDDDDTADKEERKIRRAYRKREAKNLQGLFWSAHQRFFRSLCIATKVPKAIEIAKEALNDNKCVVIGVSACALYVK